MRDDARGAPLDAARSTLRRLARALTDAIQRQEVHQWSRGAATTTVELELRALCTARDALEVMSAALDARDGGGAGGLDERRNARARRWSGRGDARSRRR